MKGTELARAPFIEDLRNQPIKKGQTARFVLTKNGEIATLNNVPNDIRKIEAFFTNIQKRSEKTTGSSDFERLILVLVSKTRDLSDAFIDFEKEYNRIKREGKLIVSSDAQEAKMSKQF